MKFAKVVVLASALAVPTFSISGFAKAADSQTIVLPKDDGNPTVAEKLKVEGLKANVGKYCKVNLVETRKETFFEGTLKSVSTSWLVLEGEEGQEKDGKTVQVKIQTYLPMKDVDIVIFSPSSDN